MDDPLATICVRYRHIDTSYAKLDLAEHFSPVWATRGLCHNIR